MLFPTRYDYESVAGNTSNNNTNYDCNNNNNNNNQAIPYHARENSLPFSYLTQPKSLAMKTNRNGSYNAMNTIRSGSGVGDQTLGKRESEFDDLNSSNTTNSNLYYNNKEMKIKPQSGLTSPLLVRKTFKSPTVNTISNTYAYGNNINKENNKYNIDEFDSGFVNESLPKNVPYVTLSGTLDNNKMNKSRTLQSYEDFEELLHERREKVLHGSSPVTTTTINKKYTECVSSPINNKGSKKLNNYDFEFNLLNLIDDVDEHEHRAPLPPRRKYTLESVQKTQNITTTTTNLNDSNNWHITPLPATSAPKSKFIENIERLDLNVGYKQQQQQQQQQHFETQKEPWPGYHTHTTTTSKYNNHSSHETTYGNGNVAGYRNNNIERNSSSSSSWKEADIHNQFDSLPIYATSMKKQQQQQQLNVGKASKDFYRSETPSFPVTPRTPSLAPTLERETSNYQTQEVAAHLVKFAKDSSKFWYKPNLSREEAISLLINAIPGTFVVRDSTTYKNAYGLVLRVAGVPPGVTFTGKPDDLVRHFLIEPTTRGVRLKGCANEPVFTSLSALVYEHSINQLALPCLLHIPEHDLLPSSMEPTPAQQQLLTQGAACNVLLLFSAETESLTGEAAIRKAIRQMYEQKHLLPTPIEVHFKVTQQGITLTDITRKRFFRKHYSTGSISYCGIDPDNRLWTIQDSSQLKKTIFAFVARRSASSKDNQCHIFCDLEINQPASAIVSFVNKTLPTN